MNTKAKKPGKKTGPKPRPSEKMRTHPVGFRLTSEEKVVADALALAHGLRLGEWFRMAALGAPLKIVPETNKEVWRALAPLGSNLNQVLRAIGMGEQEHIPLALVQEMYEEIKEIRRKLVEL